MSIDRRQSLAIRSKIVDGRIQKRVKEVALLEQPFIKDSDKTVREVWDNGFK